MEGRGKKKKVGERKKNVYCRKAREGKERKIKERKEEKRKGQK